jgi:putative transposase
VRAGLVADALDWPWSSARAHSKQLALDPVLDIDWMERAGGWDYTDWRERLSSSQPEEDNVALRRATLCGGPLGSREFVAELERGAGRRLRVLARGRPKKGSKNAQECMFAAEKA